MSHKEGAHFLIRIAEVLNLRLCEFSDSEQSLAGSNFIAVGLPNLGSSKWQLVPVVVK